MLTVSLRSSPHLSMLTASLRSSSHSCSGSLCLASLNLLCCRYKTHKNAEGKNVLHEDRYVQHSPYSLHALYSLHAPHTTELSCCCCCRSGSIIEFLDEMELVYNKYTYHRSQSAYRSDLTLMCSGHQPGIPMGERESLLGSSYHLGTLCLP